jgi:hypothetical protein
MVTLSDLPRGPVVHITTCENLRLVNVTEKPCRQIRISEMAGLKLGQMVR